jgi:hypothetical protein
MKLQTKLKGPLFEGIDGVMFLTIEETGPALQFIFDVEPKWWVGFSLKETDRGKLRAYTNRGDVTDIVNDVSLAEALGILKAGISDGKFNQNFCEAGVTEECLS